MESTDKWPEKRDEKRTQHGECSAMLLSGCDLARKTINRSLARRQEGPWGRRSVMKISEHRIKLCHNVLCHKLFVFLVFLSLHSFFFAVKFEFKYLDCLVFREALLPGESTDTQDKHWMINVCLERASWIGFGGTLTDNDGITHARAQLCMIHDLHAFSKCKHGSR